MEQPAKMKGKQFCTLDQLRNWVDNSPLAHKCLIIHMTNDLDQIAAGFETVRKLGRYWDDTMLRPLFVAVSMLFLSYGPVEPQKNLRGLIYRVLSQMDIKDPMSIHGHVEYLLDEMQKAGIDAEANRLFLAMGLVRCNVNSLPVGVCLLWSMIGEMLNMEITMHRYREFKELAEAMGPVSQFCLPAMDGNQLGELCMLMEAINRVLELVIFTNTESLKKAGYPDHFFQMRHVDVDSMASWATSLQHQIDNSSCAVAYSQISIKVSNMLNILNRVKCETKELIEEVEQPKLFQMPVDNYSDLSD